MSNLLTLSYGDTPDGPAALEAVLQFMADAGAVFEIEVVQLGTELVKLGFDKGFDQEALTKIRRARVLLKAPTMEDVTTPLREVLGDEVMIFEAAAPTIPATLEAAVNMLRYLGQDQIAEFIK